MIRSMLWGFTVWAGHWASLGQDYLPRRRSMLPGTMGCSLAIQNSSVVQLIMIGAVAGFSMIGTWIILKIIDVVMGLRVTQDEEQEGLDLSQHGEKAYHDVIHGP